MIRRYLLASTMCIAFFLSTSSAAQKPPFPVSLHANVSLGETNYRIRLDRVSATTTRIAFKSEDERRPVITFNVPGVLDGFHCMGPDLILNFVYPGPTTRVYSEIDGTVRQTLECTSRFGGIPLPVYPGHAVGCLRGEKMVDHLWVPTTVQVYLRHKNGYQLAGEVQFEDLYDKVREIQKRVLAGS